VAWAHGRDRQACRRGARQGAGARDEVEEGAVAQAQEAAAAATGEEDNEVTLFSFPLVLLIQ
jgi:hypothetical protein